MNQASTSRQNEKSRLLKSFDRAIMNKSDGSNPYMSTTDYGDSNATQRDIQKAINCIKTVKELASEHLQGQIQIGNQDETLTTTFSRSKANEQRIAQFFTKSQAFTMMTSRIRRQASQHITPS